MPSSKPDLLVDHGNSRIKWALSEGGTWVSGDPIRVRGEETDFSLLKGIETPQRILVSNSAGPQALACLVASCGAAALADVALLLPCLYVGCGRYRVAQG